MDDNVVEEDSTLCSICHDGTVYEGNEILFCDRCDVAVHQHCYHVFVIPEGEWLCYACAAGVNPATLTCELCSYTGGAYRPTDKHKWAHALCAYWIPEIYFVKVKGVDVLTLDNFDKQRMKLKCQLCSRKGACVQCAYGRCIASAHAWCVLHNPQGFSKRVVKGDDGELLWEIFCKQHASSVSDPIKPKPKQKTAAQLAYQEVEREETIVEIVKPRKMDGAPRTGQGLSMSHALQFNSSFLTALVNTTENQNQNKNKRNTATKSDMRDLNDTDSDVEVVLQESQENTQFRLLTMTEWPGQAEGESMDLDHLWNVVASSFPEDHSVDWVHFMKSGLLQLLKELKESCEMAIEGTNSKPLNAKNEKLLQDALEEIMSAFPTDRERWQLFDMDKRETFLGQANQRAEQLNDVLAKLVTLQESGQLSSSNFDVNSNSWSPYGAPINVNNGTVVVANTTDSATATTFPAFLLDRDFLITDTTQPKNTKVVSNELKNNCAEINAVFEGEARYSATFKVNVNPNAKLPSNLEWSKIDLVNGSSQNAMTPTINGVPAKEILISSFESINNNNNNNNNSNRDVQEASLSSDELLSVDVALANFAEVNNSTTVRVGAYDIRSKVEDDIMARLIRSNQSMLSNLVKPIERILQLIDGVDLEGMAAKSEIIRQEWNVAEKMFSKQRVWRRVATAMMRGMRDQTSDFNKPVAEIIPASWTIKVEGRPALEPDDANPEDDEQEDAVCMACFDGTSADNNKILFCDGCNAPMHQLCYGISVIPEGDFFCDRCRYIQEVARRNRDDEENGEYGDDHFGPLDVKEMVKCCLCPIQHGAMKATTDGRWVHLCCVFWSQDSIITNLEEMGPIDVTQVPVQFPLDESDQWLAKQRVSVFQKHKEFETYYKQSTIEESCGICHVKGGFVTRCCNETDFECCSFVFHPLCAWFAGFLFTSELVDPSFQGLDRNGLFPASVKFKIYCGRHDHGASEEAVLATSASSSSSSSAANVDGNANSTSNNNNSHGNASRGNQKNLRAKYRIVESDLENIPGRGHRRKKKKAAKVRNESAGGDRGTANRVKELARDVYDSGRCAGCLSLFDLSMYSRETETKPFDLRESEFEKLLHSYEMTCHECTTVKLLPKPMPMETASIVDLTQDSNTAEKLTQTPTKSQSQSQSQSQSTAPSVVEVPRPANLPLESSSSAATPLTAIGNKKVEIIVLDDRQKQDTEVAFGYLDKSDWLPPVTFAVMDERQRKQRRQEQSQSQSELEVVDYPVKYSDVKTVLSCSKCKLFIHTHCAFPTLALLNEADVEELNGTNWLCKTCSLEVEDPRCVFCPRRGGFFRRTTDSTFIHHFCALNSCAHCKVGQNGVVDIVSVPKEAKKRTCYVCNRKDGVLNRCCDLGCTNFSHVLCGERSGKAYSFVRLGERTTFCYEHIPERIEKKPPGMWVDEVELSRVSWNFDRARMIVDLMSKREKIKRTLNRIEGDRFLRRFQKMLLRAGRQAITINNELVDMGDSDGDEDECEEEDGEDHDVDATVAVVAAAVVKKNKGANHVKNAVVDAVATKPKVSKAEAAKAPFLTWVAPPSTSVPVTLTTAHGLEVSVSESFLSTNSREANMFGHVGLSLAGVDMSNKDFNQKEDKAAFVKRLKDKVEKTASILRKTTRIFPSTQALNTFEEKLMLELTTTASMSFKKFVVELEKLNHSLPVDLKVNIDPLKQMKASKVEVPAVTVTPAAVVVAAAPREDRKRGQISSQEPDSSVRKKGTTSSNSINNNLAPTENFLNVQLAEKELSSNNLFHALRQVTVSDFSTIVTMSHLLDHNGNNNNNNNEKVDAEKVDFEKNTADTVDEMVSVAVDNDWAWCRSRQEQVRLEARVFDILNEIEAHQVPARNQTNNIDQVLDVAAVAAVNDETAVTSRSSTRRRTIPEFFGQEGKTNIVNSQPSSQSSTATLAKTTTTTTSVLATKSRKGGKKEEATATTTTTANESRFLCGDFTEIPDAAIPDYDYRVRRRLTTTSLQQQLNYRRYLSLRDFEKDFYEMLNNGLYATENNEETRVDALLLQQLFIDAKQRSFKPTLPSNNNNNNSSVKLGLNVRRLSQEEGKEASAAMVFVCHQCQSQFEHLAWPVDAPLPSSCKNNHPSSSSSSSSSTKRTTTTTTTTPTFLENEWVWICPPCVSNGNGNNVELDWLLGWSVLVWWGDDRCFYEAAVTATDPVTHRQQLFYRTDHQLEFTDLASQITLFRPSNNNINNNNSINNSNSGGNKRGRKSAKVEELEEFVVMNNQKSNNTTTDNNNNNNKKDLIVTVVDEDVPVSMTTTPVKANTRSNKNAAEAEVQNLSNKATATATRSKTTTPTPPTPPPTTTRKSPRTK